MSWVNKKRELQKKALEDDDPILLLSGGKKTSGHDTNDDDTPEVKIFSTNLQASSHNFSFSSDSSSPLSASGSFTNPSKQTVNFSLDDFINNLPSSNSSVGNTNRQLPQNSTNNTPRVIPKPLPRTNSSTPSQPSVTPIQPVNPPKEKNLPVTPQTTTSKPPPVQTPQVEKTKIDNQPSVQKPSESEFTQEMFEVLKRQVLELEKENQKLRNELKDIHSDSLMDMVEEIPKTKLAANDFDEYFDTEKRPHVFTLADQVIEGLRSSELNKVFVEKGRKTPKKRPPVYGETEDEDEEIISSSVEKDEFEYRYKQNGYLNYNKELDGWCNIRRVKDFSQKVSLLKKCGKNYDVVIPVILTFEQSLTFRAFMEVLNEADRQECFYLHCYIKFLKKLGDLKTLQRVYKSNGMIREGAILQYQMAILIPEPYERIDALEHALSFLQKNAQAIDNPSGVLGQRYSLDCAEELTIAVANLIHLTSRQIKIDEQDNVIAKSGKNTTFIQFKKYPVYNTTLSETLKYCLFYHNSAPDDLPSSPRSLAKFFGLSQHRFLYEAIVARSRINDWKGVMAAFSKAQKDGLCYCSAFDMKMQKENSAFMKLLSGKPNRSESNSILNIFNVLHVLKTFKAPLQLIKDVIEAYSFQKTEVELKLELAKEYRIYDIAIQCIVNDLKDRDMLIKLKDDVNRRYNQPDKMALQEEINNHLYSKKIKWKKATISI